MTAPNPDLLFFFGDRCPFTKKVEPAVADMESELKTKVTRLEVWSDAENRKVYDRLALGKCQGVPFFINKKTEAFICGASSKEKLKEWAAGQASKKS